MPTRSLRAQLIARLAPLGVTDHPLPGRDDGFSCLRHGGKELAHFHHDHELDLRLTAAVIARERLVHPPGSKAHPTRGAKSPFIEVRFTTAADLDRVVALVRLAIAARLAK
jgi:Family of unknown function (DUF5519)